MTVRTAWQRQNRNSFRQVMRSRVRGVHLSAAVTQVKDPTTGAVSAYVLRPGKTYRRPQPKELSKRDLIRRYGRFWWMMLTHKLAITESGVYKMHAHFSRRPSGPTQ